MTNEESNQLYQTFVSELSRIYGGFENFQFKKATNATIASELNYSNSQFSRLIHNTASHGELERAVNSAHQLVKLKNFRKILKGTMLLSSIIITCLILLLAFQKNDPEQKIPSMKDSFKNLFKEDEVRNFYTKLQDLPSDCNFPSYKYQGEWVLNDTVQIPLFREKNGFHIRISKAVLYTKSANTQGTIMEGYELETMEIWYDLEKRVIDEFLVSDSKNQKLPKYNKDFLTDKNFVKLATSSSVIRHEFNFEEAGVQKKSSIITRDINYESDQFEKIDLKEPTVKKELEKIAFGQTSRKPINCALAPYPKADFHKVEEGDQLNFSCLFNIKNYGDTSNLNSVLHSKSFKLKNQYITATCN
ncbi:MAG: hypothetical protein RLZZ593_721 [Bacteroidota bacterium]|jgi:hypothetical protein